MFGVRISGLSGVVGADRITRVLDAIARAREARALRDRDNASELGSVQGLRTDSGLRSDRQS